ncbi:hypothetical protein ZWY2020_001683 [Hordeum vulgare]|nr:hypothetical protein ZWY2020_001683 [Hordeum vulgare]
MLLASSTSPRRWPEEKREACPRWSQVRYGSRPPLRPVLVVSAGSPPPASNGGGGPPIPLRQASQGLGCPGEGICPGELNQPVHVPQVRPFPLSFHVSHPLLHSAAFLSSPHVARSDLQLEGRRCGECGHVFSKSYEPPADEPWTTRIFGCTDDPESCTCSCEPYPFPPSARPSRLLYSSKSTTLL